MEEDRHEEVSRCVAAALEREGWHARPALPEMRKLVDGPGPNVTVKNAIQRAVAEIGRPLLTSPPSGPPVSAR
jgi:hypothetical protein